MKKCIKNEVFNKKEPALAGNDASGLNVAWVLWYMEKHNCTYGQAVVAGLNRLDQPKPKRRIWPWQR